jgi:hypothetical protein
VSFGLWFVLIKGLKIGFWQQSGNSILAPGNINIAYRDADTGNGPEHPSAGVAQLVEHLICNQRVAGSNPVAGSK